MNRFWLPLSIAVALAFVTLPAHAYLDPASGSMLLQMIVGGIAGLALTGKLFWQRILGFFSGKPTRTDEDDAA